MAQYLQSERSLVQKIRGLLLFGVVAVWLAELWHMGLPINKSLWTPSFVLLSSGYCAIALAACLWLCDVKRWRRWSAPFVVFGANAIVAYVLHVALEKLLELQIAGVSVHGSYLQLAEQLGLNRFFSAGLWILAFLALCYVPVWWMYQRKIFVKI